MLTDDVNVPGRLRGAVLYNAMDFEIDPRALYPMMCSEVDQIPDFSLDESENYPVEPRMWTIMEHCEWFEVFDIIESIHRNLSALRDGHFNPDDQPEFEEKMNRAFNRFLPNWELVDGEVQKKKTSFSLAVPVMSTQATTSTPVAIPVQSAMTTVAAPLSQLSTSTNSNSAAALNQALSSAFTPSFEVCEFAKNLKGASYLRTQKDAWEIQDWLDQFDPEDRPLILIILKAIQFFSLDNMHDELRLLKKSILDLMDLSEDDLSGEQNLLALVPFGAHPAKSSYVLTRLFCDSNGLEKDCVAHFDHIEQLTDSDDLQALIFVDDLLGSGDTLLAMLHELESRFGNSLATKNIPVIIATVAASRDALEKITSEVEAFSFTIRIVNNHVLDKVFDSEKNIFSNDTERARAKKIVLEIGSQLFVEHPLGWEDSQLLIVFHYNCPDNTLPIIWKSTDTWRALFERLP